MEKFTGNKVYVVDDAEAAAKAEQERNARTVRNLQEVFGKMELKEGDTHMSLMFQEQSPLIAKYLKDNIKGGEGGEVYNQMAPGIAMLGFEMARSGFGRGEISSGDKKLDKEIEETSQKRYQAAENVFNQLMSKMHPEGTSRGDVLLVQLDAPLAQVNEGRFSDIKEHLAALYEKGVPDDDREILAYQSEIDALIGRVGDVMGESASTNAELGVKGEITVEEMERSQTDMLTMAMVLTELQRLRKESIRHKFGSSAYDHLSPVAIKRIENLERKTKNSS